ncbi:MAG: cysteine hydrolase [Acidimicrobiales bacterium]
MPTDLRRMVAARHTAVVTMEIQRGVVGDLSTIPELAREAESSGLVGACARLLAAARSAGVAVVHCTAGFRPDGASTPRNAPIITALMRRPDHLVEGTPAVELVPALGPEPSDYVSARRHGVSPFGGTSLDATLRGLGVTTVVATGVSLNLGIPGLAIEAVNHGYRVVLPQDAVCGVPATYARSVIDNTMALVATLTTVDELVSCWSAD